MSNQDPTDFQSQIDQLTASILNSGGAQSGTELLPTPIGVPKYQVTETGEIARDAEGNPVPWTATVPYGRPLDTPIDTPPRATSRIDPGSQAGLNARRTPPKYWSHDAWTLIDGLSSEDVYGVQRQMIDAGLLKPKGTVAGNWTNHEATAFQQVLSLANQSGVTWDVALSHLAANGRANPPEVDKVQRPQVEVHKANPFALGQVADKISAQFIGHRLSDADRAGFVEWWSQYEDKKNAEKVAIANAQENDTMTAGGDVTGGGLVDSVRGSVLGRPAPPPTQKTRVGVSTINDAMSPEEAAEQYIREHHGAEVSQTQQTRTFDQFLDILGTKLGGGVPGRPGG